MSNLIAHCGSRKVDEAALAQIAVPAATATWCPIGHQFLVDQIMEVAAEQNVQITKKVFAVSEDGDKMFGVLDVSNLDNADGSVSFAVGIRNSMDKTLPAGICFGARVFVCDNLAFSGEVVLGRRHTKNILKDLPTIMRTEFSKFSMFRESHYRLFDALKSVELTQDQIWGVIGQAYNAGAITKGKIADVYAELSDETHIQKHGTPQLGGPNTAWSVYNAGTRVMQTRQARNMIEASSESIAWHQTFANRFGAMGASKIVVPVTSVVADAVVVNVAVEPVAAVEPISAEPETVVATVEVVEPVAVVEPVTVVESVQQDVEVEQTL
jgi:hypothetical protein